MTDSSLVMTGAVLSVVRTMGAALSTLFLRTPLYREGLSPGLTAEGSNAKTGLHPVLLPTSFKVGVTHVKGFRQTLQLGCPVITFVAQEACSAYA